MERRTSVRGLLLLLPFVCGCETGTRGLLGDDDPARTCESSGGGCHTADLPCEPGTRWIEADCMNPGLACCLPDGVEETPPDFRIDPTGALEGSAWTSTLEGSLGTYITWHTFSAGGVLDVAHEVRGGFGPDASEVLWTADGAWQITPAGDVRFEYEASETIGGVHAEWTFADLSKPLATALYDPWHADPTDAVWSNAAVLAQSAVRSRFRGLWRTERIFDGRAVDTEVRRVELSFEPPLALGVNGRVRVEIEVAIERGAGIESDTEVFDWAYSVAADGDLHRVRIADFTGDANEVFRAWQMRLAEREISDRLRRIFEVSFVPQMFFDPSAPEVLGYPARWEPLLVRQTEPAPTPEPPGSL